jgi:uncharacterized membrane protein YedE/YeeE
MAMSGPLEVQGFFGEPWSLALAFAVGLLFGFFLERAGFGSARKLTGVFYLKDFAVPKVMLSAILVAMVGLLALGRASLLDLDLLAAMPTYIWPQLAGGLLLGIGFVVGGYCPGTSAVAAASGKWDALVFMAGLVTGIFGFAGLFDRLETFYFSGDLGDITLSDWTGLPPAGVVFLLLLVAGAAFWLIGRIERRPRKDEGDLGEHTGRSDAVLGTGGAQS